MDQATKTPSEPSVSSESELSRQIFADRVNLLYQNSLSSQIATILIATITVMLMWSAIELPLLVGWLGAMLLLALLRLLLARSYRRASPPPESAGIWARRYVVGATIAGLLWEFACITIMLTGAIEEHVIAAFIIGGMAIGAIGTSAPLYSAYFGFMLPITIPFVMVLILGGDRYHLVMGLFGLVFMGMLVAIFRQVHLALLHSLTLRYENTQILKNLATAHEQLRESEERNRLLLESVGEGIFGLSLNLQGECSFCNPAAASLLGYQEPGELLGKDIHTLIHHHHADGSEHPQEQCRIMQTLLTGEALHVTDEVFYRADGTSFPVEYHSNPIRRDGQLVGAVVTFLDVTLQRQAQAELARRDAILEAMTFSTRHLLTAASSEEGIAAVLKHLGQAMEVCRVYIFEKHLGPDGRLLVSQRHEWAAPGVSTQISSPELQNLPFAEGGFGAWVPILERGEIVTGAVREFPADVRAHLEAQEIRALLLVPIFSAAKWWGFIGFDSCKKERSWSSHEKKALKLAADLFGAAIERQKSDADLRQAAIVFANTHEGIAITDADARVIAVNTAFSKMTGFPKHLLLGENLRILKSGRQDETFYQEMWNTLLETGRWQGEIWNRRLNGEIFPVWLTINAVRDAAGAISHYVSLHSDISVIKRSQEEMEHLAHHDPLTKLPNRLLCLANMGQALERARRGGHGIAVLYLDLDRFKQVNDTLGHPIGDALLQGVASRLSKILRKQDTVARLGGDEFTMILEDLKHPDDAELIADKVIKSFSEPFMLAGNKVTTTTSIGISRYPGDGETIETLLKHADEALYQAKQQGRNTFRYYSAAPSPP